MAKAFPLALFHASSLAVYHPRHSSIALHSPSSSPKHPLPHEITRDYLIQVSLTDCVLAAIFKQQNEPLDHIMGSLAQVVVDHCDSSDKMYETDKILYLTFKYYEIRASSLHSGVPITANLPALFRDAEKLFQSSLESAGKSQSQPPKSIKDRANFLKNNSFSSSGSKNWKSYKYYYLLESICDNSLEKALCDLNDIQDSEDCSQKLLKDQASYLKKLVMRRLLWQNESEGSAINFNILNSTILKIAEQEPQVKASSKDVQDLSSILTACSGILLGNQSSMLEVAGKNFYAYLKLLSSYSEQGLQVDKLEELVEQFMSRHSAGELSTEHKYLVSLIGSRNYHRSYMLLKSIFNGCEHQQFYLQFLGSLAFYLDIPKPYLRFNDSEYYTNIITRLIASAQQSERNSTPKLLINTESIVEHFLLPREMHRQPLQYKPNGTQCYHNLFNALMAPYLYEEPISTVDDLNQLASFTSCVIHAHMTYAFFPYYRRLVNRQLQNGLDEHGINVIGIQLCTVGSQFGVGDYEGDQDYYFNRPHNYTRQIPYPFSLTQTFEAFESGYLTDYTIDKPFEYELLECVKAITAPGSMLHMQNPDIAQMFLDYFENYQMMEGVKKIKEKSSGSFSEFEKDQIDSKSFKEVCQGVVERFNIMVDLLRSDSESDCGEILRMSSQTVEDYYLLKELKVKVTYQNQVKQAFDKMSRNAVEMIGSLREYINFLERVGMEFPLLAKVKAEVY